MEKRKLNEVPIVFAVDDNYAPYLAVTLESIVAHASQNNYYSVYVLNSNLSEHIKNKLRVYQSNNMKIDFVNVTNNLDAISSKLYLRDYYTNTTYYRFFIPALFPQYDKVLYLDCDIIVLDDIANLYNTHLGRKYLGAVSEEVMTSIDVFGEYVEKGLDINRYKYFNAGILVMNLKALRNNFIEDKFIELLSHFKFEVTQDQDYLNVLCKGKVKLLNLGWNKTPINIQDFKNKNLKLVHYKMSWKPWCYDGVLYGDYFWEYAKNTNFYDYILEYKNNYNDDKKQKDKNSYERLKNLAINYVLDENNYKNSKENISNKDEIYKTIENFG